MMHLRNILAAFALAFCGSALAVEIQDMTELAAAPASGDLLIIVDVSDTTDDAAGTGKRITTANLAGYMYGTAGTFTAAQTAQITDAGTTTVVYPLIVDHQSSGTPANGIGSGIAFDVETAAANTERGATIEAIATDVTAASEDFALVAKTMVAGSTTLVEGGRWVGAQYLAADGTSGLPAISFAQEPTSGLNFYDAQFLTFSVLGTPDLAFLATGIATASTMQYLFTNGTVTGGTRDTGLARNAAGVIRATNASTGIRGFLGGGAAVASAAALPVPTGRVFHVTGTTGITSITSTNFGAGTVITLIFDDILTVSDGNNLVLAGAFVTAANSTLTLAYDGTSWFETGRSTN